MSDDNTTRAGLYVLGLMNQSETDRLEADLAGDAELREEVVFWQSRFAPLAATIEPVAPPADLWTRIEQRVEGLQLARGSERQSAVAQMQDDMRSLERSRRWARGLAVGFGGLFAAATAAAVVFFLETTNLEVELAQRDAQIATYVAVLSDESNAPLLLLEARQDGSLRATPLGDLAAPDEQTLELWTLLDPAQGPISLGPLQAEAATFIPAAQLPGTEPNQLFEVSLEPPGGSPTGRPTGPVLMIGRGFVDPTPAGDS